MWKEAGVCGPVACWQRVTAATEGLCGRAGNTTNKLSSDELYLSHTQLYRV